MRAGRQVKPHLKKTHAEERSGALCTPGCPSLALPGGPPGGDSSFWFLVVPFSSSGPL